MCLPTLGLDHNIINVHFDFCTDEVVKDGIHGSLVCSAGILEAKRHNDLLIRAECPWASKSSLVDISLGDKNLIIAGMSVHERKNSVTGGRID